MVKLDVSVGGPADIFGDVRRQAGPDARLMLVDNLGRTYSPMGYIHEQPNIGTTIKLDPLGFVAKLEDLPILPTSGTERLQLVFTVTTGSSVTAFRFGDITVGTCDLPIVPPD